MKKVLFIVKCRGKTYEQAEDSVLLDDKQNYCLSSGLFNSANFVSEMLNENGIESKIIQVIDNNDIDREVAKFKPTHVMIEALWVVPEKFNILKKLHPNVKWIIRLHSEIPFLSGEGNSMSWIFEYLDKANVFVAPNSERAFNDIKNLVATKFGLNFANRKVIYLPNYYKFEFKYGYNPKNILDISSFGAIRPLKNQLIQAIAAIEYAKKTNQRLRFHINTGRVEHGNNVLKNIRSLFEHLDSYRFQLIEHDWLTHDNFLNVIRGIDVALQMSYSETFNITTADAVSQGIPVVTSKEIFWVSKLFYADPNSVESIVAKIRCALFWRGIGTFFNRLGLKKYNKQSKKIWLKYLN